MSRLETVTSPQTLGAGRITSWSFPILGIQNTGSTGGGVTAQVGRPIAHINDIQSGAAGLNQVITGVPPNPQGWIQYKGRVAFQITSNTGTGKTWTPNFATQQAFVMPFQNVKGTGNPSKAEDFACWSFSGILAFDAIPGPIVGDVGITLGVGTRAEIRGAALFAGIELGPSDVGTISVIARQADGGALTLNQVVTNTLDLTLYHEYELRIIGATSTAEAQLKVLIDGSVLAVIPWGAGTVLPDHVVGGAGNLGFTAGVINKSANAATVRMYVLPYGFTICAAPTELDLA